MGLRGLIRGFGVRLYRGLEFRVLFRAWAFGFGFQGMGGMLSGLTSFSRTSFRVCSWVLLGRLYTLKGCVGCQKGPIRGVQA